MGLSPRMAVRQTFAHVIGALLMLLAAVWAGPVQAQTFPALTGPVVDAANVIPADAEARLTQKLLLLKQQTNRELQVVTLATLQGYEIADYGYQLGRNWGLGTKDKNEAAMLIVAPNERRMRIEVGYGLEATLTDGLSSLIIRNIITPKFKAGDLPGGIEAGTDALIQQLQLPADQAQQVAAQAQAQAAAQTAKKKGFNPGTLIWLGFIFLFFILPMLRGRAGGRAYGGSGLGQIIMWNALDGMSRGGGGGGSDWGSGGGGSSWGGGGGSFGGGGSSGSW